MNDLTDVKLFLTSLFRPIIYEAIRDHLAASQTQPTTIDDGSPYGGFDWLKTALPNIPPSTLRIKSAAGEIPGVVKFGKRVLYEKAVVLNWLRSQTLQVVDMAKVEHTADLQISSQLNKQRGGGRKALS